MSDRVERLREEGPLPAPELFGRAEGLTFSPDVRREVPGLRRVRLKIRRGRATPVWYIEGEHEPEDVVRAYVEANPRILEMHKGAVTAEFADSSRELADAWSGVADEYDVDTVGGHHGIEYGGECPLCGEEYERSLADHLVVCKN